MRKSIRNLVVLLALLVVLGTSFVLISGVASAHSLTPAHVTHASGCSYRILSQGNLSWGNSYKVVLLDECQVQKLIGRFTSPAVEWSTLLSSVFGLPFSITLGGGLISYKDWIQRTDDKCGDRGEKVYIAAWLGHPTWIYPIPIC